MAINNIERVIGSRGTLRVILEIIKHPTGINISEVAKKTKLNHTSTDRHLKKLIKLGLVKEHKYGKVRIYESSIRSIAFIIDELEGFKIEVYPKIDGINLDFIEAKIDINEGVKDINYPPLISLSIRNKILNADGLKCVFCGEGGKERPLEVHHIDGNRYNNSLNNLITLCHLCHRIAHREKSKDVMKDKLIEAIKNTRPYIE